MEEMTELKEISSLQEANQAYKKVTGQIVIGFVAAGYILKKVRDKEYTKSRDTRTCMSAQKNYLIPAGVGQTDSCRLTMHTA